MSKTSNKCYIVTACRWGSFENHSYTLGCFKKKNAAIMCANSHSEWRGGKYACIVEECVIDEFDNDNDSYVKEVYRAKSVMEQ